MIVISHLADAGTAMSIFWFGNDPPSLGDIANMQLQGFQNYEVGILLSNLEWLSKDILILLFGITFFALILTSTFIFKTKRKSNQQLAHTKSLQEGADHLAYQNDNIHHFIEVVSHDLKSPLNSITAFSELLALDANHLSADEIEDYAKNMHLLATRINHLVNNMMNANNIEFGEVKLKLTPVSVEQTILEVFDSLKILGNQKSIKTSLSLDDVLPNVIADQEALRRVLENLINNAYKFSAKNTHVQIKGQHLKQESKIKISVQDQGPGFTEKDKSNLYDKFSKLSAKPTGHEKSTGLGLFIVQKLVGRMNGSIELESSPGQGSVFSVILEAAS